MRQILAIICYMTLSAFAGEHGKFVEHPNLVGKITDALVASKLEYLTPHISRDGGRQFSYHLKSVTYLGTMERGSERFILATALFIRSSAQGSEYPPARGHGYLLCLTPDLQLVTHCRLDFPEVNLAKKLLLRQNVVIADFAATDEATRRLGFLIDGDDFLPYPFTDKLPDQPTSKAKKP